MRLAIGVVVVALSAACGDTAPGTPDDMAVPRDLAVVVDQTPPRDLTPPPDQTAPIDQSTPPDQTAISDLSVLPDIVVVPDLVDLPDLAAVPDLVTLPDLVTVADLARVPDLVVLPDLAPICTTSAQCPSNQACVAEKCVPACTQSTWVDLTGKLHDGTLRNFAFNPSSGWVGSGTPTDPYALQLDGTDDFVDIAPAADKLRFADAFAVEVWTRLDARGYQTIFSNRDGTADYSGYSVGEGYPAGRFSSVFTTTGNSWNFLQGDAQSQLGAWVHIVLTYSRTAMNARYYLNGAKQMTEIQTSAPVVWSTASLPRLGEKGAQFPYKGRIAVVRVWSDMLTAAEVLALYQKDAPRFGISSPPPTQTVQKPLALHYEASKCQ